MHKGLKSAFIAIFIVFVVVLSFMTLIRTDLSLPLKGPKDPLSLFFAGDSISDGWYASKNSNGFVSLVEDELSESFDVSSSHSHRAGYRLKDVMKVFAVPSNLQIAVIELGTNDVRLSTNELEFESNYRKYLGQILHQSPHIELICVGVFAQPKVSSIAIDHAIERSCHGAGGKFVGIMDVYEDSAMRGPSDVETWIGPSDISHPNDSGHREIANRVLRTLSSISTS